MRRPSAGLFLHFLVCCLRHTPVGHRGGENGDVGGQSLLDHFEHIGCRFHTDGLHSNRVIQINRPRHQRNACPGPCGGACNGVALLA